MPKGKCSVCGEPDGVSAFVTRLYEICLGRLNPSESEVKGWAEQLWNHTKTGKQVAFGFVFSAEFQNKNYSNEKFVELMYQALFGREPDAGKATWINMLNNGGSRLDVFNGFANSLEFTNLCQTYGIKAR